MSAAKVTRRAGMGAMLLLCASVTWSAEKTPLVLGVVPQFPALEIYQRWTPLAQAIEQRCGQPVELRPSSTIAVFEDRFTSGVFDLAYMNPYHAVMAHRSQQFIPLVRDNSERLKGVLVVASDSPLHSPLELQGKTIAFPSPNAFGASLLMRAVLDREVGVQFTSVYVKTHSNAYCHVLAGEAAAAGGIKSTLEREPPEVQSKLKVLFETPSFPPHPLSAHPRVPEAVRRCVQKTLVESPGELLKAIQMPQPVPANYSTDYEPLERLSLEAYAVHSSAK